ncbi:helix-turn-helix domain-containing protein [Streptomyces roseus]|uniref:helix-turn-helix domain-containing protein n=1 Tax=Streptomyces roseus TaxID=66430 RepID=UPI0036771FE0
MPYPERALGRLAQGLRNARLRADLTYRQLADRAPGFSRPALQNAASGRTLPTREAVTAYAKACDTEPGPLLELREEAVQARRPPHSAAPAIERIRDEAGLGAARYNLRPNAGNPSCREVEKRTRTSPAASGCRARPCTGSCTGSGSQAPAPS